MALTILRTYIWLENWEKAMYAGLVVGKSRSKFISSTLESFIDEITVDCRDVLSPEYEGSFPMDCDQRITKHVFKIIQKDGMKAKIREYDGLGQGNTLNKPIKMRGQSAEMIRWWCKTNHVVIHRAVNILLYDAVSKCPVDIHGAWPENWLMRKKAVGVKNSIAVTPEESARIKEMKAQIEIHRKDHV